MIEGLPDQKIFGGLSVRLFLVCLQQYYLFDEPLTIWSECEDQKDEKILRRDYVKNSQEFIYSILILLFQSMENFLKREICLESPYLIIATPPKEWKNKPFNSLYLHDFNSLLKIYSEIKKRSFNVTTLNEFESLRKVRNTIVHGVHSSSLSPKDIANYVFIYLKDLWGISWLTEIKPFIPYDELTNSDTFILWRYIWLFKKYLGVEKTCILLNIKTKKLYSCPECDYGKSLLGESKKCNFAYFLRNKKTLFCPICESQFLLINITCENEKCASKKVVSNNDWGDFCLDCLSFNKGGY